MFDFNSFKRSVKEWINSNPQGTVADLRDFCEEQIPPAQYMANMWVVDQTVSWYRHILEHREFRTNDDEDIE